MTRLALDRLSFRSQRDREESRSLGPRAHPAERGLCASASVRHPGGKLGPFLSHTDTGGLGSHHDVLQGADDYINRATPNNGTPVSTENE